MSATIQAAVKGVTNSEPCSVVVFEIVDTTPVVGGLFYGKIIEMVDDDPLCREPRCPQTVLEDNKFFRISTFDKERFMKDRSDGLRPTPNEEDYKADSYIAVPLCFYTTSLPAYNVNDVAAVMKSHRLLDLHQCDFVRYSIRVFGNGNLMEFSDAYNYGIEEFTAAVPLPAVWVQPLKNALNDPDADPDVLETAYDSLLWHIEDDLETPLCDEFMRAAEELYDFSADWLKTNYENWEAEQKEV